MTHRLTARAFPSGEVWFFEKERYGKAKEDKTDSKGNRGYPEVPEKWINKPAAYNRQ